jgi:hypothetical protein
MFCRWAGGDPAPQVTDRPRFGRMSRFDTGASRNRMSASLGLPALPAGDVILPPDRRQSPTALRIQRGVRRLFSEMGCVTLPEFSLVNGRRADVIALCGAGRLTIVEIKSSVADFRADRKWPDYRDFCDRFFFAIPENVPESLIPEACGLIVADGYGAGILREAPEHPLSGPRRKAVTLRFAHSAARILHALADPGAVREGAL